MSEALAFDFGLGRGGATLAVAAVLEEDVQEGELAFAVVERELEEGGALALALALVGAASDNSVLATGS